MACCFFCHEQDTTVLDAHRVVPGQAGGRYTWENTLTLCASCHRRVHAGRIVVLGRYKDTLGRPFVHYREGDNEQWRAEAPAASQRGQHGTVSV